MDDQVVSRLRHVLLKHKRRVGSWVGLSQAIDEVNERRPDRHIDRRTLERLCGGSIDRLQLRIGQLIALDNFFIQHGEGSLLTKNLSPIDSVAESFTVNFLVAANHLPEINDYTIARWDLRAITRLLRTRLNQLQLRIWDITGPDNWSATEARIRNGSNIVIASPVANFASEVLLSRMIGIEPRQKYAVASLPFWIVAADRDERVDSAFVHDRREAMQIDASEVRRLAPDHRAIVVGHRIYVSTDEHDYGLLVAQRNAGNGQVQMVLCGLTGQSTLQLARILQAGEPARAVPALRKGDEHQPILLVVYEFTMVPDDQARGRSKHRVVSFAPVLGPTFLQRAGDEWQLPLPDDTRES